MKAELFLARFRLAIAALVSATALSGTFVFAKALRNEARARSKHHPDAVEWVERKPANLAEQIEQGRKFYARSCAECHADDASGDEGTYLRGLPYSNRRVNKIVHDGIKGEMPSFKKKYGENEVRALIAYLRSLSPPEETTPEIAKVEAAR